MSVWRVQLCRAELKAGDQRWTEWCWFYSLRNSTTLQALKKKKKYSKRKGKRGKKPSIWSVFEGAAAIWNSSWPKKGGIVPFQRVFCEELDKPKIHQREKPKGLEDTNGFEWHLMGQYCKNSWRHSRAEILAPHKLVLSLKSLWFHLNHL